MLKINLFIVILRIFDRFTLYAIRSRCAMFIFACAQVVLIVIIINNVIDEVFIVIYEQ